MEEGKTAHEVQRAYGARKLRRWIGLALVLAGVALQLAQPGIPAVSEGLAQGIFIGVVVLFLLQSFFDWQCPSCGKHLGRALARKTCPHCGVQLEG